MLNQNRYETMTPSPLANGDVKSGMSESFHFEIDD